MIYPEIRPYLIEIFNRSIELGEFPDPWKFATITPLSKVHPPKNVSDTRPIAILPELSKLFERVISAQVWKYLELHELLDPKQSAYRPHYSTQTALLGFTEEVKLAIDKRMVTVAVFFDLSKAFDLVSHKIVLEKLRKLNFSERAIRWFASYLMGRSQAVRGEDGHLSTPISTFTGVPQGGGLSPLLFAVYINDLPSVLQYTKHGMFADDTKIYLHCLPSELTACMERVNADAQGVFHWTETNEIRLNKAKTRVMVLGSARAVSDVDFSALPRLIIDGVPIEFTEKVTDLGCCISRSLDWGGQVARISSRVHGALYALRHHRHALSFQLRCRLVESLILPRFDYACAVYNDLTQEQNCKLHRLLNRCVRFVYGFIPWRAPVTPYRLALGWLSVEDRRMWLLSSLAYSVLSWRRPGYLFNMFTFKEDAPQRRISPRALPEPLDYKTPRTEALKRSFHITATMAINSLADKMNVFEPIALNRFKALVRCELMAGEVSEWRLRVASDSSLVLNPLPHDARLTELLDG